MAASSTFKQQCPSCEALVPIKDPKLIGKKVDCPNCKFRFVVNEPKKKQDDEDGGYGIQGDDAPEEKKPKSAPAEPAKTTAKIKSGSTQTKGPTKRPGGEAKGDKPDRPKKKAKAAKSGSTKLFVGLGLAGVAVVILALASFFPFGGDENANNLANPDPNAKQQEKDSAKTGVKTKTAGADLAEVSNHLPNDTQLVLNVNVQELFKSALGRIFFDGARGLEADALDHQLGFKLEDVERILFAGNRTQDWYFILARTTRPIRAKDLAGIKTALGLVPADAPIRNQEYFVTKINWRAKGLLPLPGQVLRTIEKKTPADALPLAARLHDEHTLVLADVSAMKQFLEADGKPPLKSMPLPPPPPPLPLPAGKGATPPKPTPPPEPIVDTRPYLTIAPRLKERLDKLERVKPTLFSLAADTEAGLIHWNKLSYDTIGISLQTEQGIGGLLSIEGKTDEQGREFAKYIKDNLAPFLASLRATSSFQVQWDDPTFKPAAVPAPPAGQAAPAPAAKGSFMVEGPKQADRNVQLVVKVDPEAFQSLYDLYITPPLLRMQGELDMTTKRPSIHDLGAAVREYGDKNRNYPRGTFERALPPARMGRPWVPNERVSWMADLLPYLGYQNVHRQIDFKKSWHDQDNMLSAMKLIPYFVDRKQDADTWYTRYPGVSREVAATHFVGVAGVGLDAADYSDKDVAFSTSRGIFGYDRVTSLADIGAGIANVIVMLQIPAEQRGPWLAGGGSTVRGVPETQSVKPFVCTQYNGQRGTYALMADGSVRFISANISDEIFKALCTVNKDKSTAGFDQVPLVPSENRPELKAQPPAQ